MGDGVTKYHAIRTEVDGFIFASKAEARRYGELKLLEYQKEIRQLELQPSFDLLVRGGKKVGKYKADFRYYDVFKKAWVIEDVKGVKTPVYKLKKKIVEAVYGIEIKEVSY
jgi:hypothetical protein